MIPRFYARNRGRSRAPLLALLLAVACGAPQRDTRTGPNPEIVALNDKAEAAERKREHLKAQSFLQEAVNQAKDPASAAYANRKMARLLLFWRQEAKALPYLEKSVEHDPSQVPVWNDLGVVHSKLGHPAKARAALERAVELAPAEPIVRLTLAAEMVRQSEFQIAHSHYKVLLTLDIPPRIEKATYRALELLQKEMEGSQK
jgi:tetratricopeptide (TPR) repeat protein